MVKNKIKDEISNSSIPFNANIKHKYDEISQGMGLICLRYNSIKSQVTRSRRKQLPPWYNNIWWNSQWINQNIIKLKGMKLL